jgi:hypothetical protein
LIEYLCPNTFKSEFIVVSFSKIVFPSFVKVIKSLPAPPPIFHINEGVVVPVVVSLLNLKVLEPSEF